MTPSTAPSAPHVRDRLGGARFISRKTLIVFLLYLAMSVAMTWPLVLRIGDVTPTYWGDSRLTVWVLAWDARVLADDPTDLFQGPIFYPEKDAIAYFEPHLTLGLIASPIIWATGNPFLAHNVLFLGAIALSALGAFLLARELTGSIKAGVVGGAVFAFSPYWFGHIISLTLLKSIAAWWLPFALLGVLRWVRGRGLGWLALATVSSICATLTSWYLGAITATAAIVAVVVAVLVGRPPLRRVALQGAVATAVALAAILPFTLPYRRVQEREPNYTRTTEEAAFFSASPSSYLAAPIGNRVWGTATEPWRKRQSSLESHLFPGLTVVGLAALGLFGQRRKFKELPFLLGAGLTATGIVLSLGTAATGVKSFFPWRWLHDGIVAFRALRAPARFHTLTILGLSLLAAMGARILFNRLPTRRVAIMILGIVLVLIAIEGTSVPLPLRDAPRPDPLYRVLAGRPGGVLELPTLVHDPASDLLSVYGNEFDYMLFQLAHWRPLANGIAGFYPASFVEMLHAVESLPDDDSIAFLRERNIRTVVVHQDMLRGSPWENLIPRIQSRSEFSFVGRSGPLVMYDLGPA